MAADMIDHLVTDICSVTEQLMGADISEVDAWNPTHTCVEKKYSSKGLMAKDKGKAREPKVKGVYRSVC